MATVLAQSFLLYFWTSTNNSCSQLKHIPTSSLTSLIYSVFSQLCKCTHTRYTYKDLYLKKKKKRAILPWILEGEWYFLTTADALLQLLVWKSLPDHQHQDNLVHHLLCYTGQKCLYSLDHCNAIKSLVTIISKYSYHFLERQTQAQPKATKLEASNNNLK